MLLLLLVAVIVGGVLLFIRAAAFNASVSSALFPSTALLGPLNGDGRVNVLMVGYGGEGHEGAYLADSIQVLSIDAATDTTTTIPIPRDLWIEGISAYPQNGKINEVFSTGFLSGTDGESEGLDAAGDLLAAVVSEITGLEVEHWLAIDFAGFEAMVDAVGGVTVDNPVAFDYTLLPQEHEAGHLGRRRLRGGGDPAQRGRGAGLRACALHERDRRVERLRALGAPGADPRCAAVEARRRGRRVHPARACR